MICINSALLISDMLGLTLNQIQYLKADTGPVIVRSEFIFSEESAKLLKREVEPRELLLVGMADGDARGDGLAIVTTMCVELIGQQIQPDTGATMVMVRLPTQPEATALFALLRDLLPKQPRLELICEALSRFLERRDAIAALASFALSHGHADFHHLCNAALRELGDPDGVRGERWALPRVLECRDRIWQSIRGDDDPTIAKLRAMSLTNCVHPSGSTPR